MKTMEKKVQPSNKEENKVHSKLSLIRSLFLHLKNTYGFIRTGFAMSKLAWQAAPVFFVGIILIELLQGVIPLLTAWLTKVLFDLLARSLQGGAIVSIPKILLLLLALQAGLSIVNQLISPLNLYLNAELGRKLTMKIQTSIYQKISGFAGLAYFEDPQFHDTIQLAVQYSQRGPLQALRTFTTLGRSMVTLISFIGILVSSQ